MNAMAAPCLPGLCSVTFRQLSCEEIVSLARSVGLAAIEWGTDIHLPPGDTGRAAEVARLCTAENLLTPSLGSYLRCEEDDDNTLMAIIDIACIIKAKRIRVWAGRQGSNEATQSDRDQIATSLTRYCRQATTHGLQICLEFHPNTLTDTAQSAAELLNQVSHPALHTYWQPTPDLSIEEAVQQIDLIKPWLKDLHVFYWLADRQRQPLADGREFWAKVLETVREGAPMNGHTQRLALLEFVQDDDPDNFKRDAQVLNTLCARK